MSCVGNWFMNSMDHLNEVIQQYTHVTFESLLITHKRVVFNLKHIVLNIIRNF